MLVPAGLLIVLVMASIAVDMALVQLRQRQAHDLAAGAANDAATAAADQAGLRTGNPSGRRRQGAAVVAEIVAASDLAPQVVGTPRVSVDGARVEVEVSLHADYIFAGVVPAPPTASWSPPRPPPLPSQPDAFGENAWSQIIRGIPDNSLDLLTTFVRVQQSSCPWTCTSGSTSTTRGRSWSSRRPAPPSRGWPASAACSSGRRIPASSPWPARRTATRPSCAPATRGSPSAGGRARCVRSPVSAQRWPARWPTSTTSASCTAGSMPPTS